LKKYFQQKLQRFWTINNRTNRRLKIPRAAFNLIIDYAIKFQAIAQCAFSSSKQNKLILSRCVVQYTEFETCQKLVWTGLRIKIALPIVLSNHCIKNWFVCFNDLQKSRFL